jgi:hypothetical protein
LLIPAPPVKREAGLLWATKAISAEEGEAGSTTGEGSDFESDGESRVVEPGDAEERLDGRSAFLLSCMKLLKRTWKVPGQMTRQLRHTSQRSFNSSSALSAQAHVPKPEPNSS